jgi:transposase
MASTRCLPVLRVVANTSCSVRLPYHQKLPARSTNRQSPNRKRHFRSRLVSPRMSVIER